MRFNILSEQEIDTFLDDNGEAEDGCVAIEATIGELAKCDVGTLCGTIGNKAFANSELVARFGKRVVKGWFLKEENSLMGMIHIECNGNEARRIETLISQSNGSLRPNGKSLLDGYYEFENE